MSAEPISYAELLERQISAPKPGLAEQIAQLDSEIGLLLELQRTKWALQQSMLNGRQP